MMDVNKIYTPSDLIKLYTNLKIKYDPKSYTFRDRLIVGDESIVPASNCIIYNDLGTESELQGYIEDRAKRHIGPDCTIVDELSTTLSDTHIDYLLSNVNIAYAEYIYEDSHKNHGVSCMYHKDNLYINLKALAAQLTDKSTPYYNCSYSLENKHLKDTYSTDRLLKTMVYMSIALRSNNSISKYLKWLDTQYSTKDLKSLADVSFIEPDLDSGNYKKYTLTTVFSSAVLQHTFGHVGIDCYESKYHDKGYALGTILGHFIMCLRRMHMHMPEILYHIINCSDTDIKYTLEELFLTHTYTDTEAMKPFYTIDAAGNLEYSPMILEYVSITDVQRRWEFMQTYMHNLDFKDLDVQAQAHVKHRNQYVPNLLGELCKFADNEAFTEMRVKTILALVAYCEKHNLLKTPYTPSTSSSSTSAGGSLTPSHAGTGPKSKPTKTSKSMGSKLTGSSGGGGAGGNSEKFGTGLELVDRALNNHKEGRYTYDVEFVTKFTDAAKAKYDTLLKPALQISKGLTRTLRDIKTYNTGGKESGLRNGKVDAKNVYKYKHTPEIFCKNTYKIRESDLAVGIVLDVSGSMCGKPIEDGKTVMVLLHETLKALSVNHSIITHSAGCSYTSKIKCYQSFNGFGTHNSIKNYGLCDIKAGGGNCDSGALHYMTKCLDKVQNKDKICLIFSDGQPTECTDTDLKDQIRVMERKGIKLIGIGINFDEIANYYTDYANGRNLKEMLDIMINILKKYILDKKD